MNNNQYTEQGAQDIQLSTLRQTQINWLLQKGVTPVSIIYPDAIFMARGRSDDRGFFEPTPDGEVWLAFREDYDVVFYRPKTGEFAWETGRAFALNEEQIDNPATTAFGQHLKIFGNPIDWLRHNRDGAVIVRWGDAFERLRDVPSIAIDQSLIEIYRRSMRPTQMPKLFVLAPAKNLEMAA